MKRKDLHTDEDKANRVMAYISFFRQYIMCFIIYVQQMLKKAKGS